MVDLQSAKKTQLKLYYLFMMIDGDVSESEEARLEEIRKSMEIPADTLQAIKDRYRSLTEFPLDIRRNRIHFELSNVLGNHDDTYSIFSSSPLKWDKNLQAETLWTMTNLGFADSDFSLEEKSFVYMLGDYWEFDRNVVDEMVDIANTMLALTEEKQWVKTTKKTYDEMNDYIVRIDKNIQYLFHKVEILISEANIA